MKREEITALVAKLQVESLLAAPTASKLMMQAATVITELLIEKLAREELDKRKLS